MTIFLHSTVTICSNDENSELRQMCLNHKQQYFGNMYLIGMWLGVDLRSGTKKTCIQNRLDYMLKVC